jgi:FAD/FMN-containing dehydrogenase
LREIGNRYAAEIRARYPDIPRRVSGYTLDSLLPENGFDIARLLVGSEGTLATILRAEVRLVPQPAALALVVLGYPSIADAADAVPRIVEHSPVHPRRSRRQADLLPAEGAPQCRGTAAAAGRGRLADGAARRRLAGGGYREGACAPHALDSTEHEPAVKEYDDPAHEEQMWAVRESGLGATARVPGQPDTWPGWEDAAVPPQRLGDYLRDVQRLYAEFGYQQAAL